MNISSSKTIDIFDPILARKTYNHKQDFNIIENIGNNNDDDLFLIESILLSPRPTKLLQILRDKLFNNEIVIPDSALEEDFITFLLEILLNNDITEKISEMTILIMIKIFKKSSFGTNAYMNNALMELERYILGLIERLTENNYEIQHFLTIIYGLDYYLEVCPSLINEVDFKLIFTRLIQIFNIDDLHSFDFTKVFKMLKSILKENIYNIDFINILISYIDNQNETISKNAIKYLASFIKSQGLIDFDQHLLTTKLFNYLKCCSTNNSNVAYKLIILVGNNNQIDLLEGNFLFDNIIHILFSIHNFEGNKYFFQLFLIILDNYSALQTQKYFNYFFSMKSLSFGGDYTKCLIITRYIVNYGSHLEFNPEEECFKKNIQLLLKNRQIFAQECNYALIFLWNIINGLPYLSFSEFTQLISENADFCNELDGLIDEMLRFFN